MYLPPLELHEATSLEEAAALLDRYAPDARLLAGGTDLLVDLKTGRSTASHLVSIQRIRELSGVSETGEGLLIGALTTLEQLNASPIVAARYPVIRDATGRMAAPQIRNAATVGGNIAGGVPCADLPPVLMVLGASVTLWSPAGERRVAVGDLLRGNRQTILRTDEVLTAVTVPTPLSSHGCAYARFALRDGNAIAVAAVAAGLLLNPDDTVREARIALGAVAPTPRLLESAGALLSGHAVDDDALDEAAKAAMDAAEPITDVRGSAEFRRRLVGTLTRRAIRAALVRALEAPA
jgi:carbon-monoxide dehydrogenase medium subunit